MFDEKLFRETLDALLRDPEIRKMKQYHQHAGGNTYSHSLDVARTSMAIARRLPFHVKERDLARGAMLHDFYLYGTDDMPYTAYQHGRRHPQVSYENASRRFRLTATEKDIITSHMWPLTLTHMPRCRESVIVSLADKYCASREFILAFRRHARQFLTDRRR